MVQTANSIFDLEMPRSRSWLNSQKNKEKKKHRTGTGNLNVRAIYP